MLLAVKAAISLGLLGWLLVGVARREGMDALAARATTIAAGPLLVAVGLHALAVLAGVLRWRVLLDARGLGQPLPWLLRAFLVGRFFGAFTPSTTGLDGWRALEVARRTGQAGPSAAVLVVEKLVGLVGMAVVCVALTPLGALAPLGPLVLPLTLAVAGVAVLGLALLGSPRALAALAGTAPGPLARPARRVAEALSSGPLGAGRLAVAVGLGVLSHLALSSTFAASGAALGLDVSTPRLVAVGNAIVVAVLVPVSIGGVGVREGVAASLLAAAGVSTSDAVLVALGSYLTGQVPALIGGLLLLAAPARGKSLATDGAPGAP